MSHASSVISLNNGVQMPALGLGVFQSSADETITAVEAAIGAGYRLIDTAASYRNESQVGDAIRRSGIDRSEIFVTTKLWITEYGFDSALRAFDTSLDNLGLDYLDLYLLHWPLPEDFEATVASYRAAEHLLADGRVRAIGVCNHSPELLQTLIERTEVTPAINQVELHPYFSQKELCAANGRLRVATEAWSPLGGVTVYGALDPDAVVSPLEHPTIRGLADRYGKTPAQVIVRWHLQNGRAVVPKSANPQRIAENFDVFDFELSPADLAAVEALDTGARTGPAPDEVATMNWRPDRAPRQRTAGSR